MVDVFLALCESSALPAGYSTIYLGDITLVGGGVYVPPAYSDEVIQTSIIPYVLKTQVITTVGGGYP